MTDGKQGRLRFSQRGADSRPLLRQLLRRLIDRCPNRDSHLVAAPTSWRGEPVQDLGQHYRRARSRVSWRNVVFEDGRRRISDMKCACILTKCARGQATGIACFGKMIARPAAAIVWRLRCRRIGRCRAWRVTAPGPRGKASRWAQNVTSSEVDWITHPDTCFPRATLTRGLRFPGLESRLAWGQMRRALRSSFFARRQQAHQGLRF